MTENELEQAYCLLKAGAIEGEVFERMWRQIHRDEEMPSEMLAEVFMKWNF